MGENKSQSVENPLSSSVKKNFVPWIHSNLINTETINGVKREGCLKITPTLSLLAMRNDFELSSSTLLFAHEFNYKTQQNLNELAFCKAENCDCLYCSVSRYLENELYSMKWFSKRWKFASRNWKSWLLQCKFYFTTCHQRTLVAAVYASTEKCWLKSFRSEKSIFSIRIKIGW